MCWYNWHAWQYSYYTYYYIKYRNVIWANLKLCILISLSFICVPIMLSCTIHVYINGACIVFLNWQKYGKNSIYLGNLLSLFTCFKEKSKFYEFFSNNLLLLLKSSSIMLKKLSILIIPYKYYYYSLDFFLPFSAHCTSL